MEILTGKASKIVDNYCINELKIPSLVLMERAALAVGECVTEICRQNKYNKVKIICGVGNNGADGLALARILCDDETKINKSDICVCIIGNMEKASEEFNIQYDILQNIGMDIIKIKDKEQFKEVIADGELVVDAIFGIGLSRDVNGLFADIINEINESKTKVIAIDCPSGLNSDNGRVMGVAIKAYKTVTFGRLKVGLVLCDGKNYTGEVVVRQVGFNELAYENLRKNYKEEVFNAFTKKDLKIIPERNPVSNKGTYGRIKVIAGSKNMCGAAILSAIAAYRCGAGIVEVLTHINNLPIVKGKIIEAVVNDYAEPFELDSSSIVVAGPGLSVDDMANNLIKKVLTSNCNAVIDADGLNVISKNRELLKMLHNKVIITPHIKEMSRLTDISCQDIRENIVKVAKDFSEKYGCITVIKDATTVIADYNGNVTVNLSGNSGMSTGGSGDVLSGIIGGMLSQILGIYEAACMGVYLHGLAGDYAKESKSDYGMIASDINDAITQILKYRNGEV